MTTTKYQTNILTQSVALIMMCLPATDHSVCLTVMVKYCVLLALFPVGFGLRGSFHRIHHTHTTHANNMTRHTVQPPFFDVKRQSTKYS